MKIHRASLHDTDALIELVQEMFAHYGLKPLPNLVLKTHWWTADSSCCGVWVAFKEETMAGALWYRTIQPFVEMKSHIFIEELYVRDGYREQGVGTALINHAISQAEVRSCSSVDLLVADKNEPAINLYTKHGAQYIGADYMRIELPDDK